MAMAMASGAMTCACTCMQASMRVKLFCSMQDGLKCTLYMCDLVCCVPPVACLYCSKRLDSGIRHAESVAEQVQVCTQMLP
jgi:hypothetical protein